MTTTLCEKIIAVVAEAQSTLLAHRMLCVNHTKDTTLVDLHTEATKSL